VQQWFSPTDCDDCCSQFNESVHAPQHYDGWNWLREIVIFIAVSTGKIAAPDRHNMRDNWMARRMQGFCDDAGLPQVLGDGANFTPYASGECRKVQRRK
jgi:hypothetical protein